MEPDTNSGARPQVEPETGLALIIFMQSTVIESVGDLTREVRRLTRSDQKWLFRGQPDARWELLPSVHRGYTRQQEHYLTNEFRVRARSRHAACPLDHDYPGWLALMQHYGLPTRLLDWTYSPIVAAFFAVHPDFAGPAAASRHDACIWALAAGELNESQGFEPLIFPLDAASYQPLIVPAFKDREEPQTIGVAMAIEHDARIQLQQAAFTVHSCRTPLNRLPGAGRMLHQLIVPASAVSSFCEELSLLGVRKSNLFPDLASLTSELRAVHPPQDALQSPADAVLHLSSRPRSAGRDYKEKPNMESDQQGRANAKDDKAHADLPTGEREPSPPHGENADTDEHRVALEDQNLTQANPPPVERASGP